MHSVDREVLETASRWLSQGRGVQLFTVVATWGSSPRPPGATLAIRDDGRLVGSVSGGCIEDDLIDRLQRGGPLGLLPELIEYGVSADEAHRFGLPCGGTMRLVRETLSSASALPGLIEAICNGRAVHRTLDMATGRVTLAPLAEHVDGDTCVFDGASLVTTHGPTWRLLLIGAGQLTQYVANIALTLDYAVTVCDPREEYRDGWHMPGVTLVRTMPDDTVIGMRPDARMAVVALTHDPKLDDLALMEALMSPAFYVGAIGSRRNNDKRRERLQLFGVTQAALARLRGPVGLHLGGRTPPEIAVSIAAELTARRHRFPVTSLMDVQAGKALAG
ncbi:putative xanthine dehydrogenase subunit A [Pandoraea iniqua]|uniref:Putative xanthine dehydrogenase subunit A n=1 Tax=Pandoraea iniqua TaxID=2508288 RepID=A0A5E4XGV3_9BURK|nr:XdhC family protein [Pandoraea iniqua]VVE35649.1 putative xanthine dehydrogenase subunit A [Pandoraea iniqua]